MRVGVAIAEEAGLAKVSIRGLNNLIASSSELDPRAALDACRAALLTARRLGVPTLEFGLIGSHLGAAYRTGDWSESLRLLESASGSDATFASRSTMIQGSRWIRSALAADVADDVAHLRRFLGEMTDAISQSGIADIAALEAWCDGRLVDARRAARASNALATYPMMIALAARCALWSHDLEGARADLSLFDAAGAHGPALSAVRLVMAAGVAALEGDVVQALRGFRDGRAALHALGLRWDGALAAVDMIESMPDEPAAQEAAREARAVSLELGAAPFLARIDAALARARSESASPA